MKTHYSKNMKWLEPFVRSVRHLVPVDRIGWVRGYRVRKGLEAATYGSKATHGNWYTINLLAEEWSKSEKRFLSDSYEVVLDTLAHELAHTVHFKHTPEHFRLKYRIGAIFSNVLADQGIKDHSKPFMRRKNERKRTRQRR